MTEVKITSPHFFPLGFLKYLLVMICNFLER